MIGEYVNIWRSGRKELRGNSLFHNTASIWTSFKELFSVQYSVLNLELKRFDNSLFYTTLFFILPEQLFHNSGFRKENSRNYHILKNCRSGDPKFNS